MTLKGAMVAASVASLFVAATPGLALAKGAKKVVCSGINDCKGKGGCKGDGHDCAGKNECKGKGAIKVSEKECKDKGGTVVSDK